MAQPSSITARWACRPSRVTVETGLPACMVVDTQRMHVPFHRYQRPARIFEYKLHDARLLQLQQQSRKYYIAISLESFQTRVYPRPPIWTLETERLFRILQISARSAEERLTAYVILMAPPDSRFRRSASPARPNFVPL